MKRWIGKLKSALRALVALVACGTVVAAMPQQAVAASISAVKVSADGQSVANGTSITATAGTPVNFALVTENYGSYSGNEKAYIVLMVNGAEVGTRSNAFNIENNSVQTHNVSHTFPAAGSYNAEASIRWETSNAIFNSIKLSFMVVVTEASGGASPSVADPGPPPENEFDKRHYEFWLPVFVQLKEGGNSASVTIDTAGHDILHVRHFVFDALVGTNRTLTVKHDGATYVIRGRAEGAGGRMGSVLLGHNHTFGMLDAYRA